MTNVRWMITLLILSVLLAGCGMVENSPTANPDGEPTHTPIPAATEPPAVEPTHTPIPAATEPPDAEPTQAPIPVEEEPPSLYMLRGDVAFPMDRGSYCWSITDEGGICLDVAVFPIFYAEEEYTPVIGNTLELRFDAPFPDTISARLYPDPSLTTGAPDIVVEAVMDDNGRVLVTVPDDVNGHYALLVFATWDGEALPHGDASYSTPVRFDQ
jgi:hypothetical protein